MDVIALAEAGIDHAVAPLGTAITEAQLEALWKLAPEPVVALDGDGAGLAAAQRLIDLALPHLGAQRSLRFAVMPAGQDPDDVVKSGGAAAIAAVLAASKPVVELLWARETEGQVLDSPERRAALDARLRAHLARIADPRSAATGSRRSAAAAPRSSRRRPARRAAADAGRPARPRTRRRAGPPGRRGRAPRRPPPRGARSSPRSPTRPSRRRASARARSSPAASTIPGSPTTPRSGSRRFTSAAADLGDCSGRPLVCPVRIAT